MKRRIKGFTNKAFLKIIEIKMMIKNTAPPHKKPIALLPNTSAINHENAITRNSMKKRNIKLMMLISTSMLIVLDNIFMLDSLKICILVSRYSFSSFLFS